MATTSAHPPAVQVMANHVLRCLEAHRAQSRHAPLFVGVQGPQGSGKTFLTSRLQSLLTDPPYSLSVAVLSIDDLYLPHAGLVALAETHPCNRLLHGRGQPGTHDVALGSAILRALKIINSRDTTADNNEADGWGVSVPDSNPVHEVALPIFDKSLFDGEGDRRSDQTVVVRSPVDVVVLEGWCVGFYPVPQEVIEARWRTPVRGLDDVELDMREMVSVEDVVEVNALLRAYVEWWRALDTFVQIRGPSTSSYGIIYRWRLQQEHDMKAKNGGRGMTDTQVKMFVDRYIPGYVFFGDGVSRGTADEVGGELPPWHGHGLVVELDPERKLLGTRPF